MNPSVTVVHTWGSIFRNSVGRGDDHGYAAFLADEWEKRERRKGRAEGHSAVTSELTVLDRSENRPRNRPRTDRSEISADDSGVI